MGPLHDPVGNNLAVAIKVEALINKGELELEETTEVLD